MIGGLKALFSKAATGLTQNLKSLGTNLKGIGNDIITELGAIAAPVLAFATINAFNKAVSPQPA